MLVIQRWNALPEYVVTQASLLSFKRKLEVEIGNIGLVFCTQSCNFFVITFVFACPLVCFYYSVLIVLLGLLAMYISSGRFSCICTAVYRCQFTFVHSLCYHCFFVNCFVCCIMVFHNVHFFRLL